MKYEILKNKKHADLNLDICGVDKDLELGICYGPVIRENYIIECCTAGYGSVIINGKEFKFKARDCYILLPGDTIIHTNDKTHSREGVWCGISGINIGSYLKTIGITSKQPFVKKEAFDIVYEHINAIIKINSETDAGAELRKNSHLHMIFGELLRLSKKEESQGTYIRKALNYMEMHYNQPLTVTDIASELGLERCYFSTLFKNSTGKTPHAYLSEIRIKKACMLFESGDFSISEVSQAVGIEIVNFSRVFKKHTGKLPNEYKKSIG